MSNHLATVGLDFASEKYQSTQDQFQGQTFNMKVWDTAGMERFQTLTYSFYKKAEAICIAFSVSDRQSFEKIQNWITAIKENASLNVPVILVGTKIDVEASERVIS